jgi:hypothetical protein
MLWQINGEYYKITKKMAKKKTEIPKEIQVYTEGCDFCMQFDYDEPYVVGASPDGEGGLEIVLKAYQDAGITFLCPNTGKKLRLFARPITDAGREILVPSQLPGGNEDIKEF